MANKTYQLTGRQYLQNAQDVYRAARPVITYAENLFKAYKTNKRMAQDRDFTGTQTKSRKKQRSVPKGTMTTATSAGFVKAKKSVRKFKRKTTEGRLLRSGVSHTIESGRVLSNSGGAANQLFGVGHGTCPLAQVEQLMWATVVKKLIAKAGYLINSDVDVIPTLTTDVIEVRYRFGPGASSTSESIGLGVNNTLELIVALLINSARLYFPLATDPRMMEFIAIVYKTPVFNPQMNASKLEFFGCNVQMYCKSSFKLQNRSVTVAADNEADDINNVPLYGKTYEGKGTGVNYVLSKEDGTVGGSFVIDGIYGNMIPIGTGNATGIQEPPPPTVFDGVKKYGKLRIEPGNIKTSTLIHKQTIGFNKLYQAISIRRQTALNISNATVILGVGKYRFMMLEKMIDCTDAQAMSIAMEHNLYMVFNSTFKESQTQIAKFTKVYQ